jgi:hypothetical protein
MVQGAALKHRVEASDCDLGRRYRRNSGVIPTLSSQWLMEPFGPQRARKILPGEERAAALIAGRRKRQSPHNALIFKQHHCWHAAC